MDAHSVKHRENEFSAGELGVTQLSHSDILQWLREERAATLQNLYTCADAVRRKNVGNAIHLRGLIEISSHCQRQCMYCGLRKANRTLERYRITREEIEQRALQAVQLGYRTVVMQAGEDDVLTAEWISDIVRWIKRETPLAVTLSLGERNENELQLWRDVDADRYLLRFETSDEELFCAIHPRRSATGRNRIELLRALKRLGYEVGGGVMVGIPGQSYESLARDVLIFCTLDLDMVGIGPYIARPSSR
jgi:biotin synthase